jgi:iron complex outermembrane recepter protein
MLRFLLLCFFLSVLGVDGLQAQPDSTVRHPDLPTYDLQPILISRYPRSITYVDPKLLRQGDDHSIEYALNTVPGVRFESRGPGGSRRVSIRGSLMRSGFGVRGVKAYLDGVPLTGPDGNTPLEVVDVAALAQTDVLRGPQCAELGPGTGGVLRFQTADPAHFGRWGGNVSATVGGFGYSRFSAGLTMHSKAKTNTTSVLYVRERYEGYRAQEGNHKDFLLFKTVQRVGHAGKDAEIGGTAWYYDGGWQLPGGLDSLTKSDAPRSANLYSQQQSLAAVQRKWLQAIAHYRQRFGGLVLHTNVYGQWTHKLNPFGTSAFANGYKDETGTGWGSSSELLYRIYTLRVEAQAEPAHLLEYENIQGQPGNLRLDQRVTGYQGLMSLKAVYVLGKRWEAIPAASLNFLATSFRDQLTASLPDVIRTPVVPQGSLRFFYLHTDDPDDRTRRKAIHNLNFIVSTAYSPPNWWELRMADGSIDGDLRPENGLNFEVKYGLDGTNHLDVQAYHMQLYGAILPYTDSTGQTRYRNAESCGQTGLESSLERQIFKNLNIKASAAWMHYRFLAESATGDFARGNAIPGIPAYTGFVAASYQFQWGTLLRLSGQLNGPIWLDSRNTRKEPASLVFHAFFEHTFGSQSVQEEQKRMAVRLSAGVNNVLDAAYSNYLNVNDRRGNFWNPAPGRNFFAGLQFTF